MPERVEFSLCPSRIRRRLCQLELGAGTMLFIVLLLRQPLAWWLVPAVLVWFGTGLRRLREPARTLIRGADGWWLAEQGGTSVAVRLAAGTWFGPGLAVLRLRPIDDTGVRMLGVWADQLPDTERRRLYRAITTAN